MTVLTLTKLFVVSLFLRNGISAAQLFSLWKNVTFYCGVAQNNSLITSLEDFN